MIKIANIQLPNSEIIEKLKQYQNHGGGHPFTCRASEDCLNKDGGDTNLIPEEKEGKVILICPCGKYAQDQIQSVVVDWMKQ